MATKKPAVKVTATKKTSVKKPPVKPTTRKPVKKASTAPIVIDVSSTTKSASSMLDKAIDLIKWVDTPFKLFEVIILASVFFFGYFAWDSRQVILGAITNSTHKSSLREIPVLEKISISLLKDLEAETVVVHKANLVVNGRTTLLAYGPKGRETAFDGYNSTLFNKDPARNSAMITMMNGEVYCGKQEVSGKTSEWESKQGVKYTCWASIPPDIGEFEGYISLGFFKEPSDLTVVKTRMNLASTEMAK
jgi:hypothetical protein